LNNCGANKHRSTGVFVNTRQEKATLSVDISSDGDIFRLFLINIMLHSDAIESLREVWLVWFMREDIPNWELNV
jgi:hypothetical protein